MLAASPGSGQVNFELLQTPGNFEEAGFSLSRDGADMGCVLGGSIYWWSQPEGFRFLDAGAPHHTGVGMAADGGALVAAKSTGAGPMATIWYADGASIMLDPLLKGCPDEVPSACGLDLNSDGTIAVGMTANCAVHLGFRWNIKTGLVQLDPSAGFACEGLAVSADGSLIVGFSGLPDSDEPCPTMWRTGSPPENLLGPNAVGKALNISLNGLYTVGQASLGQPGQQAFVWTRADGHLALGNLSGLATDPSGASAVSNHGIVVGWSGDEIFGDQEAFIWTRDSGMRSLADILREKGVRLPQGLSLTGVLDISGDSSTLVGICRDRNFQQGYWRLRLEDPSDLGPLVAATPAEAELKDPARPDTMNFDRANMLLPFPFGKRGNLHLPRP